MDELDEKVIEDDGIPLTDRGEELVTDDEFNNLIPFHLPEEQYNQHEKNLLKESKPGESIILRTWNGTLIDDYLTYKICRKHDIKFKKIEEQFSAKDEAMLSVLNRHLAIPSYPAFVKIEIAKKIADILGLPELAKEKMVKASHPKKDSEVAFQKPEKQHNKEIAKVDTTKWISEQIDLSPDTVSKGLQLLNAPESMKQELRASQISIHQGYNKYKKREKELKSLKIDANDNEFLNTMIQYDKDVRSKKISDRIIKEIDRGEMNLQDLDRVIARTGEERSKLLQLPAIILLPAPAPHLLMAPET